MSSSQLEESLNTEDKSEKDESSETILDKEVAYSLPDIENDHQTLSTPQVDMEESLITEDRSEENPRLETIREKEEAFSEEKPTLSNQKEPSTSVKK